MSGNPPRVTGVRPADEGNQVVTVEGGHGGYRRSPCGGWDMAVANGVPADDPAIARCLP